MEFNEADDALKALQTPDMKFNGKKLVIKPRTWLPKAQPAKKKKKKSPQKKTTKCDEVAVPMEVQADDVAGPSSAIQWDSILSSPSVSPPGRGREVLWYTCSDIVGCTDSEVLWYTCSDIVGCTDSEVLWYTRSDIVGCTDSEVLWYTCSDIVGCTDSDTC